MVKSLINQPIDKVRLLGQVLSLDWEKTNLGVEIQLPAFMANDIGYAIEVSLKD